MRNTEYVGQIKVFFSLLKHGIEYSCLSKYYDGPFILPSFLIFLCHPPGIVKIMSCDGVIPFP